MTVIRRKASEDREIFDDLIRFRISREEKEAFTRECERLSIDISALLRKYIVTQTELLKDCKPYPLPTDRETERKGIIKRRRISDIE